MITFSYKYKVNPRKNEPIYRISNFCKHKISLFVKVNLFIFMLFACSGSFAQLKGDTYAKAQQSKLATITYTYAISPGFLDIDANGKIVGICADLMRKFEQYVKEKKGITLRVNYQSKDPSDFTLFLDEVKNAKGGVFGLSNTTITSAREKIFSFSTPYINNVQVIMSHNSVPTLHDLKDVSTVFKDMTAVTIKNSTNEKKILAIKNKYYPNLNITYESLSNDVLTKILNNPRLFTSLDCTYLFSAMKEGKPIKRHMIDESDMEKFGIIMPKSNDWAPVLNEFMLSGFINSVAYKKIIADNLGQSALKFYKSLEQ